MQTEIIQDSYDLLQKIDQAPEFQKAILLHRGLSNKTRMSILALLNVSPRTITQLSEILNMKPSTISRHIFLLKASSIVQEVKRDGRNIFYGFNEFIFLDALDCAKSIISIADKEVAQGNLQNP